MYQPPKNGSDAAVDDYGATVVTGSELAAVLGLSEAHIFTLKRRNVIQPVGPRKNEYQLGPAVRDYVAYKCAVENESHADFARERSLKERANRQLREILLKQTKSQLHDGADVESIQTHSNKQIRSRLLEFSNSLALQLIGKEPAETKDIIDTEVRKVLVGLTRYDAKDYYRWLAHSSAK